MTNNNALLGTLFPTIKVKTLSKKQLVLPNIQANNPSILCLVFQQQAQETVDSWTNYILKHFKKDEINYLEIPMISGGYGLFQGIIDGGMRSGIPVELHDYVATYYGTLISYKKELFMSDPTTCYTFVLDVRGIIRFSSVGASTENTLNELHTTVTQLLTE